MDDVRAALERLEAATTAPADALAPLAYLLSQELGLTEAELNPPVRRALLLLAAGGDPTRGLEPDGRAVRALAADLDAPETRRRLVDSARRLRAAASGLPRVAAALDELAADHELAGRWAALALLADELGGE